MKTFIIITVLSALVACYEASDLQNGVLTGGSSVVYDEAAVDGAVMSNADINARNQNYRLLYEMVANAPAASGRIKNSFVTYRGPSNVRVNRIVITNQIEPAAVYHSALNTNNMEIRITSNVSRAISSTVKLYQRSGAGRAFGEPAFHLMVVVLMYFGFSQLA